MPAGWCHKGLVLGQQSWRPGSYRRVPNGGDRKVGHGEPGHAGENQTRDSLLLAFTRNVLVLCLETAAQSGNQSLQRHI